MVDWTGITILALQQAWESIIGFLPLLLGALLSSSWMGSLLFGLENW
jgi:hypothetical protein